jgi:hypothetical protein
MTTDAGTGAATGAGANGAGAAAAAAAASGAAGGTGGANGASGGAHWSTGLNDDLRGYAQNKGWADVGSVVESYRNFEKLKGVPQDRLLTLPEKLDAPEMKAVWERLGKPKEAKEYMFQAPEGGDKAFTEWAQNTFFEADLPRAQAEKIVGKWNEYMAGKVKAENEASAAALVQQGKDLQKKWGQAHDQNIAVAKQAAERLGFDGDLIDAMESKLGFAKTMEFMHGLGEKLGEAKFVDGGSGNNRFDKLLTPEQARDQITQLRADSDFNRRYLEGDTAAKDKMNRLHQFAYPTT